MRTKILLLAIVVVAATAFLYGKTQTVDLERHEEVRQALGELSEASAGLSEDVLKLRCSLLANYDSVAASQRRFGVLLDRLDRLYGGGGSPEEKDIVAEIASCREALARKGELAEEFKSQSAVLENSLDYLPALGYSLSAANAGGAEFHGLVSDLLRDTFAYNRNTQAEVAARLRAAVRRIGELCGSLEPQTRRATEFLIAHVENVLRTKPAVDALLGRIASVPVSAKIERLRASVAREYDLGVQIAARYRRALLLLSAALLLTVVVILAKLQQNAAALAGANHQLEVSVREVARKEAESRAILEGAADGILSLDDQGRVLSVNPAGERLFGYAGRDSVGRSFESLVSTPWEPLKGRLGQKQEVLGSTRDRSIISLELILSGIDVGDRKVYIAILQDITERKRMGWVPANGIYSKENPRDRLTATGCPTSG